MDLPREKKLLPVKAETTRINLGVERCITVNCKTANPELLIEAERLTSVPKTIKWVTVNPDEILKWSNSRLLKNADNKEGAKIIKVNVNDKKNKINHIYLNSANKALKSIIRKESRDGRNV